MTLAMFPYRRVWMEYFRDNTTIVVAFWSAQLEIEAAEREGSEMIVERSKMDKELEVKEVGSEAAMEENEEEEEEEAEEEEEDEEGEEEEGASKLLTREELIDLFHAVSPVPSGSLTTVGMVSQQLHITRLSWLHMSGCHGYMC